MFSSPGKLSRTSSISSIRSDSCFSAYSTQSHTTVTTEHTSRPSTSHTETSSPTTLQYTPTYIPRKPPIKIILGTASIGLPNSRNGGGGKISTANATSTFLTPFLSRGYLDIDTARNYPVGRPGSCEKLLGSTTLATSSTNISTKVLSFTPGSHKAENIHASIDRSLRALNVPSLDIVYLHAPDRSVPLADVCLAMDTYYQLGKFERFGLSNYNVADVEEILAICEEKGYVKPSVYQGQYNLLCRDAEPTLLPLLRKHNIAFYAYSPSACGFLSSKTSPSSANDTQSRWSKLSPLGRKYTADYFHAELFAAASRITRYASHFGISGHAAALRWVSWHSALEPVDGDAIIIGASSETQLEENLDALEQGPLPAALVKVIEEAWKDVVGLETRPRCAMFP